MLPWPNLSWTIPRRWPGGPEGLQKPRFFLVETTEDEEFGTMVHGDVYYQRGAMNGSFEPVFVFIVSPKTDRHVGNLENAVEA